MIVASALSFQYVISPEWKTEVGVAASVNWPVGVGGDGNEGVAALVERAAGAIGYVEYAYATQHKMAYAEVQNHGGNFIEPKRMWFQVAAANADWIAGSEPRLRAHARERCQARRINLDRNDGHRKPANLGCVAVTPPNIAFLR